MMRAADLRTHRNPQNWKHHPASQRAAFRELVREVGWVGFVLLNETTGHMIDGHMRIDEAKPDELVPVIVGSWTTAQEKLLLAGYNPLANLAEVDPEAAAQLLERLDVAQPTIHAMLQLLDKQVETALGSAEAAPPMEDEDEEVPEKKRKTAAEPAKRHRLLVRCETSLDRQLLITRMRGQGNSAKAVRF